MFFTCVHFKKNCTDPSAQSTPPDPQTSALRDLYICHFGLICLMRYPRAGLYCIASLHIFIYTKRSLLVDLSKELSEGIKKTKKKKTRSKCKGKCDLLICGEKGRCETSSSNIQPSDKNLVGELGEALENGLLITLLQR